MGPLLNAVASEEGDLVAVASEVLPLVGASEVLPLVEVSEVLPLVEVSEVLPLVEVSEVLPLAGASGASASARPRLALRSAAARSVPVSGLPQSAGVFVSLDSVAGVLAFRS